MAEKDRKKWDAKYLERLGNSEPSSVLEKYWSLAPVGKALDIACGNGRNSIFLADKGFVVDAVDISKVATDQLAGRHSNINVICTDLDTWDIQPDRYDLIVNIRFLDRRLFPMIQDGLKPGGILIFESFMNGKKDKYCLKKNELLHAFQPLRVVYYEEKKIDQDEKFDQVASLVAIKAGKPLM
ncbi:SAM-dependent methyltransferase [Desulfosarcina widdelii]|uniref:SAM-dependent methyltransferase n=1 Tax=Desulfosarcina widdelii TaxID=947919 RepID=A0A5K7Z255_9BACT|nr:methyltransferase domain-containing protein [Desulfosarcina widdelii]BBO75766.1 SAM-dependent methyltransferase [Desulfosarcina widdelii]